MTKCHPDRRSKSVDDWVTMVWSESWRQDCVTKRKFQYGKVYHNISQTLGSRLTVSIQLHWLGVWRCSTHDWDLNSMDEFSKMKRFQLETWWSTVCWFPIFQKTECKHNDYKTDRIMCRHSLCSLNEERFPVTQPRSRSLSSSVHVRWCQFILCLCNLQCYSHLPHEIQEKTLVTNRKHIRTFVI